MAIDQRELRRLSRPLDDSEDDEGTLGRLNQPDDSQYALHERSQTIEEDGRWYNVYGPGATGGEAGTPLPPKYPFEEESYDSLKQAEHAARKRSQAEGKRGIR